MADEEFDATQYCLPLRSMADVERFMEEPPAWRTLCKPLTPHSTKLIDNIDLVHMPAEDIKLENPPSFCHFDPDEEENVPRYDEKGLPKTLVCHDMANGYHDDCFLDGSSNFDNYMFYNWSAVDVFCYFSHCLVTVPPLGWINVAHAHGVKVIGTLITEHAQGAQFWDEVLESEEQTQELVSYLVTIAKTLKFEGWLLNVENKISQPAALVRFVGLLHSTLHAEVPHATLIWYDSVTVRGDLFWQNKLNHLNQAFFDACDGIFTNYSWSEADVLASAQAAGARRRDVFVGLDVWGRNFYGGGMLNTQAAVRVAHAAALSIAIFAPAWTHEACSAWPDPADRNDPADSQALLHGKGLDHYARYTLRDLALWGSLWPFLRTRPPCTLPFVTSFCMGHGLKRRMYGEVLVNGPWYNLRHMQYQPNSIHGAHRCVIVPAGGGAGAGGTGGARLRWFSSGILRLRESFVLLNSSRKGPSAPAPAPDVNQLDEEDGNHVGQSSSSGFWRRCKTALKAISKKKEKEESAVEVVEKASMERVSLRFSLRAGEAGGAGGARAAGAALAARGGGACLAEHLADSFIGGSCLLVSPPPAPPPAAVRLFHTDFYIEHSLVVCVVTKPLPGASASADHHLALLLQGHEDGDQNARRRFVLVCHASAPAPWALAGRERAGAVARPLPPASDQFRALRTRLLLTEPDFYVPVENCYGWTVNYFEVHAPRTRVTCISGRPAGAGVEPMLLGHLGLCGSVSPTPAPAPAVAVAPAAAAAAAPVQAIGNTTELRLCASEAIDDTKAAR